MPKPKSYDINQVKDAIEIYFHSVCFGDVRKLKMTQICRYLRENGFPEINDRKLNRDEAIRSLIDNLKESSDDPDYMSIVSYSPLNADDFIKTNNNIEKLRIALTNLDNYYGNLCSSIIKKYQDVQNAYAQIAEQAFELSALNDALKKSREEISQLKKISKGLEIENKKYRTFIKNIVLPEIANEILRQEHIIHDGESGISKTGYEKMVMNDNSCLKDELNKIRNQESKFKNSLVSKLYDSINEDS